MCMLTGKNLTYSTAIATRHLYSLISLRRLNNAGAIRLGIKAYYNKQRKKKFYGFISYEGFTGVYGNNSAILSKWNCIADQNHCVLTVMG